MAWQQSVDRYRFNVSFPLETAAKVRMMIRGKTVPAQSIGGRGVRKERRLMTPSDQILEWVDEKTRKVKLDKVSYDWILTQRKRLLANREKADAEVAAGVHRKPKSEWKKRGRVKGKVYPKYEEAMKRVNAERRANGASAAGAAKVRKPRKG